jgi:hypothetical protein
MTQPHSMQPGRAHECETGIATRNYQLHSYNSISDKHYSLFIHNFRH